MKTVSTVVSLMLLCAGTAQAQGLVERATDWTWPEAARPDASPQLIRGLPA